MRRYCISLRGPAGSDELLIYIYRERECEREREREGERVRGSGKSVLTTLDDTDDVFRNKKHI